MNQPSPAELRKFLEVFDVLDRFEAQQRVIRGYGAFDPASLPIPEVIKTIEWLQQLTAER